ncbi:MAG: chemotaxis protein CheW [Oligoflexales bacterium]
MKNLEKYINEYIEESLELLDNVCDEFLEIEKDNVQDQAGVYKSIYRSMHTIKGSSQLYGIYHIGNVAHGLETCLDSVRKGKVNLSKNLLDRILIAIEYIRKKLESLYDHSKLTPEYLKADNETIRVTCSVFAEIYEKFEPLNFIDSPEGLSLNPFYEVKYIRDHNRSSVTLKQQASEEKTSEESTEVKVDKIEDIQKINPKPASEYSDKKTSSGIIESKSNTKIEEKPKSKSGIKKKKVSLDEIEGVKFGSFGAPLKKSETKIHNSQSKSGIKKKKVSLDEIEGIKFGSFGDPPSKAIESKKLDPSDENQKTTSISKPEMGVETGHDQVSDTVRVPVSILNNLMNLIGELILIRNQLLQLNSQNSEYGDVYSFLSQNLNVLTNKLQNEILKTRLQPINLVFSKLKRSVRDYSRKSDKAVRLDISGQHTEVDKTILESIEEPICQLAKIAVLTGIETQSGRIKNNKPEKAIISVNARREGGQIIVTVADDGCGQNLDKIKEIAISEDLVTTQEAGHLDEKTTLYFLFASSVSKILYKNCGPDCRLDIVKESLEKFGGSIDIESFFNTGTKYTLKLPLTLTILPALIVQAKEDMFVIPQANLVELSRIDISEDKGKIDWLGGSPVYKQRGRILPLLFLNEVLEGSKQSTKEYFEHLEVVNLVVLVAGNCRFGLVVDEIINSTDIVIKPLIKFLTKSTIYSGATIMGDGKIALTLDVLRLANLYNLMQNLDQGQQYIDRANQTSLTGKSKINEYLLIDIGIPGFYGIPLDKVNRLEEIDESKVFYKGKIKAVNYRHKVMPLLPRTGAKKDENYKLIVLKMAEGFFGLEVNEFMDIIRSDEPCQGNETDDENIKGSIIYNEKIINILDVDKMLSHLRVSSGKNVA